MVKVNKNSNLIKVNKPTRNPSKKNGCDDVRLRAYNAFDVVKRL